MLHSLLALKFAYYCIYSCIISSSTEFTLHENFQYFTDELNESFENKFTRYVQFTSLSACRNVRNLLIFSIIVRMNLNGLCWCQLVNKNIFAHPNT